jgi:hypothetical protein
MCSKIWSRVRAVLAVLFSTLAPLATAFARTAVPLHGALHFASGSHMEGFVTELGLVELNGSLVAPLITTADGSAFFLSLFASVCDGRYFQYSFAITGGTDSLTGAQGSITLSGRQNAGGVQVSGALILP